MYDDGGAGAGAPLPAMGGEKRFNLEALIPLVLLLVIGIASLNYFNVIDIPFLPKGSSHIQVLVIGNPSLGEKVTLDNSGYFLTYRVRDAATFYINSADELAQYDIVLFDQSLLSDKSVSTVLGEAMQQYVQKGGKLIIVKNSGIYQNVGLYGLTASDIVGWKSTFGNIIPADCVPGIDGVPTCQPGREISVVGRIYRQDYDHEIMAGVEVAPPMGSTPIVGLRVLPVQATEGANTIAFVKSENTPQTFPAIIEKKSLLAGTVVYFNYDPGLTPGIFSNTLKYLR